MRQRNDTGHAQTVMAWPTEADPDRRPFVVGPGEEKDFPELLAGFTPLDQAEGEEPAAEAEPDAKPAKPTRSSKNAAASAAGGSEQP